MINSATPVKKENLLMTPQKPANFQSANLTAHSSAVPLKRRHLPIESKKKVFNEWGAVLQHQDELERFAKMEELN